jgi:lysozyme family protein
MDMSDFDKTIVFILGWETEWGKRIRTNNPGDPGGDTMYGFSHRAHPEIDFDTFTEDQAKAKYFSDYWERYGCAEMRWPINFVHMDCCVNVGNETAGVWHGRANKILQRALGEDDDGRIGPLTTSALRVAATIPTAARMIVQRQKYYRTLSIFPQNGNGWLNRTEALLLEVVT